MKALPRISLALLVLVLPASAGSAQIVAAENADLFKKSLEAARQALDYYGVYDDPEELRRVADLGYRIALETRLKKFPFSFYLVDIPVPNAFALPGGQIFLTRGMLDLDLTDDMLAGLIGHEIGHVVLEHGTRMQRRATLLNALSQVVLAGVIIASNNGDDYVPPGGVYDPTRGNRVMGAAAAGVVVSELLLRSYSREFEDEADDEGQRFAAGAGFDPAGYRQLMELMRSRLPETKEYGYWRTHPFFESRVKAAEVRSELLAVNEPSAAGDYRRRTQAALLEFGARRGVDQPARRLLEDAALTAWPVGVEADRLRLSRLHELRDAELAGNVLSHDYGGLIERYRTVRAEVAALAPEAELLATLDAEIVDFEQRVSEIYPRAVKVFAGGVYETGFLETFISNFPQAGESPAVALALGDAYSRLRRPEDAVEMYLETWRQAPDSEDGRRARTGLKVLTPIVGSLSVLQELSAKTDDPELHLLAEGQLRRRVAEFSELANGSLFLRTYPDSPHVAAVTSRLNNLAEGLFVEAALYQKVGDDAKALDRINRILTDAPFSPAAEKLRKKVVVQG